MAATPGCDLFVLVGESSGDAYGAALVERLLAVRPDLTVAAMGGPRLRAAGAEIEQGIEGLDVMGFLPVLARLGSFLSLQRRMAALIARRRPRVVLSIDYPGFNLRLLRDLSELRAQGTRLVHLVAPQVWAWRPRRAKKVAQTVDRLLCFFPFEPPLFTRHGCQADFVGHPLLDLVPQHPDTAVLRRELDIAEKDQVLLLAPGSRPREVGTLLPIMDAAVRLARPHMPGCSRVLVSRMRDLPHALYRQATDLPLVEGAWHELCAISRLGAVTSGTATLEATLVGMPHAICYRGDRFSAAVARQVIRTAHVGLPNIVAGRRLLPELLQDQCEPRRLASRLIAMWKEDRNAGLRVGLAEVRARLGGGGAMGRILAALLEELTFNDGRQRQIQSP